MYWFVQSDSFKIQIHVTDFSSHSCVLFTLSINSGSPQFEVRISNVTWFIDIHVQYMPLYLLLFLFFLDLLWLYAIERDRIIFRSSKATQAIVRKSNTLTTVSDFAQFAMHSPIHRPSILRTNQSRTWHILTVIFVCSEAHTNLFISELVRKSI